MESRPIHYINGRGKEAGAKPKSTLMVNQMCGMLYAKIALGGDGNTSDIVCILFGSLATTKWLLFSQHYPSSTWLAGPWFNLVFGFLRCSWLDSSPSNGELLSRQPLSVLRPVMTNFFVDQKILCRAENTGQANDKEWDDCVNMQ